MVAKAWWHIDVKDAADTLETDPEKGLSPEQAAQRLHEHGPNQLKQAPPTSPWALFFDQFKGFIIWVLIGAAVVSGLAGEWIDTLIIFAIVILPRRYDDSSSGFKTESNSAGSRFNPCNCLLKLGNRLSPYI